MTIADVYRTLTSQPLTQWERMAHAAKPPKINGKRVWVNLNYLSDELLELLFMRARLPFPVWQLGGWVVIEGWERPQGGAWTPLSVEELEKKW